MKTFWKIDCEFWDVFYSIPLLMWIRVEQVLKLTNLTNKMNNQNHVWVVKFQQEIEKWIWLQMMRFSCRIVKKHVSIDSKKYFMRFGWKCVFAIRGGWVSLMEFDERKVLKFKERVLWVEKTSEKFKFSYLEKVFSLEKLGWNVKSWKTQAKSSLLSKISSKLSLLSSSHSLQS